MGTNTKRGCELCCGIGTDALGSVWVWFASVSGCVLAARKFTFCSVPAGVLAGFGKSSLVPTSQAALICDCPLVPRGKLLHRNSQFPSQEHKRFADAYLVNFLLVPSFPEQMQRP